MAQCTDRALRSGRGGKSKAKGKGLDTLPHPITGLKLEKGAKECRWPLEAGKGKEMDHPLVLPDRNTALPTP